MYTDVNSYKSRSMNRGLALLLLTTMVLLGLLLPVTGRAHAPGLTTRVSVASDGAEANDASPWFSSSALSADGRFVAFNTAATNLLPGGNLSLGMFVHDRRSGITELVSVSSRGREGEGFSSSPAMSADGRYVAFDSDAPNLVRGDRNDIDDVFRHDRLTGETIRVSVSSDGQEGSASSHAPAISADGRFRRLPRQFRPGTGGH